MTTETNDRISSWEERRKQFSGGSQVNQGKEPQSQPNSWEEKRRQFLEANQQPQLSDAQMANLDIPTDEILAYHNAQKPQKKPEMGNPVVEAGKGVLLTGTKLANIVPEMADTFASFGAWAGQAGGGDGTYQPAPRLQLPDELQPQDPYAKLAAEIGPYLIPLLSQEKAALALAGTTSKLERAAVRGADMVAENTVGALAQNSNKDNASSLAADLGVGVAGSGIARAAAPLLKGAYNTVASKFGKEAQQAAQQTGEQAAKNAPDVVSPERVATEDALRALAAQKKPDLANSLDGLNVNIDPEIRASADRLGLTDDLLPSHMSGNQQYIEVEQAIKSRAGSALNSQENEAILNLSRSAAKLIDDVATVPDALSLNTSIINKFDNRMNALEARSNRLYEKIDTAIPPRTSVEARNTVRALETEADKIGGWHKLEGLDKEVYKEITPSKDDILTYYNLNKIRRKIGAALFKKQGPYKDADEASLSRLYATLSEDQRAALGNVNARRDFEIAQRLVQMRKSMEEQSIQLRGRNLTGDVANKGNLSVSSLAKGNSRQFIELMNNLPSRQMRQDVIATSIRDMLSVGKRGADFNPAGFADWYQNLLATGNIRILAKHMPKEFMLGLRDVYNVARGIQKARVHEIKTGKLNEFTQRFDAVTKQYELVAKYADKAGMMVGSNFGALGTLAGDAFGKKIADKARRLGGSESSLAADKLLSSPEFQEAAKGIKQPVLKGTKPSNKVVFDEAKLRTSKAWSDFYNSLPDNEKRLIARLGFVWWANHDDSSPDSDK
ncbi:hypothetical protein RX512_001041 [Providencia rettgeri]|nr:hypothetical protein [Providencia rettgeri]